MAIELEIDHLSVAGVSPHAREELAQAIEQELDRLVQARGLPFGMDVGSIDIGNAALQVAPQATVAATGVRIARHIMAGIHREAGGQSKPEFGVNDG